MKYTEVKGGMSHDPGELHLRPKSPQQRALTKKAHSVLVLPSAVLMVCGLTTGRSTERPSVGLTDGLKQPTGQGGLRALTNDRRVNRKRGRDSGVPPLGSWVYREQIAVEADEQQLDRNLTLDFAPNKELPVAAGHRVVRAMRMNYDNETNTVSSLMILRLIIVTNDTFAFHERFSVSEEPVDRLRRRRGAARCFIPLDGSEHLRAHLLTEDSMPVHFEAS
ncbi:hypothetical protein INR49_029867 [Caranx melampygus]|nr:hypothetical protein INR49_029867 [Caranx melampygus]